MTATEPAQGRPVPDVADLRLLAEIIDNGAIGLPQAAWNAGMSQAEAAARLVTMAERGMPLRLVAEGDRQQLWHIAQAGPVTPVPPVFFPPPVGAPAPTGPPAPPAGPLPPVPTVPDTGPLRPVSPDQVVMPEASPVPDPAPAAVWGVPGSANWVRPTDQPSEHEPDEEKLPEGEPTGRDPVPGNEPTRRVLTSGRPVQPVVGLFGEQLDIGLQQILDPADAILTAVGYRIDEGERALLVQTSVGNRGPVPYESLADLYLEVLDARGNVLRKAAMAVAGYPAHTVGVPAHTLASGWTVFLVPADTEVAQLRWSVRPDLPDRTVSWAFGPAPVDPMG